MAAHKRYNMKALGRLVDSNRLTGVTRPPGEGPSKRERDERGRLDGDGDGDDDGDGFDGLGDGAGESTDRVLAIAEQMDLPIRLTGSGGGSTARLGDEASGDLPDDGVDRSGLGSTLTRSGLSFRLDDPTSTNGDEPKSQHSLARQMLDGEIQPGGRISDPRDVPGIVLDLAKDVPASVAVSVVRIDEEVEVVGDSIDPSIDPALFTSVFSGLFRVVRPAVADLENGPLGSIRDVVVEGERMDLILRPLGARYFLMVMEDRSDPQANLAATRTRMAWIAPGLGAILAQQDGEV
jgi:predicted regulator of Ras-like GTPase activity (Roadblock/LC7/MglB family)